MTKIGDLEFYYSGPSGGPGGDEWHSPEGTDNNRLVGIDVWAGDWIDSITVFVDNVGGIPPAGTRPYKFGGDGGGPALSIQLAPNQRLVRVQGTYGHFVNALDFTVRDLTTGAENTFSVLGQDVGPATFDYEAPPGIGIAALWGRAGRYLDSIGVNYLPFNDPNYS